MFGLQSEPAGVQAGKGRHAENDDCRMFIKRTVHSDVGTGADTFEGLAEGGTITAPGTGGPEVREPFLKVNRDDTDSK